MDGQPAYFGIAPALSAHEVAKQDRGDDRASLGRSWRFSAVLTASMSIDLGAPPAKSERGSPL